MLYRIQIVDTSGGDHSAFAAMPVWNKCGFGIAGQLRGIREAVDSAVKQQCDLLVCMNRQPDLPAAELLRRLARRRRTIPTLVVAQNDDSAQMRECFLLGALDYLTEPVKETDIREALMRAAETLGKHVARVEYMIALERSVAPLPNNKDTAQLLKKLRSFLLEVQGVAATTELAADYFELNRDYFARWFKTRLGVSFSKFYRGFLMEYAKLLLLSGHYRVQDVSRLVGFSSVDYFTKLFRSTTGKNPSEFRSH